MIVFTDRHGGVSAGAYESMNLGTHVGDVIDDVERNRYLLANQLGLSAKQWVWLHQVHGGIVVDAAGGSRVADGSFTTSSEFVLAVMTADCLPIALIADSCVAAVHAGWPGLRERVIQNAVEKMRQAGARNIKAIIGPSIRPCHYEFMDEDLLAPLIEAYGQSIRGTTVDDRPGVDLQTCALAALEASGVSEVDDLGICTFESPDYYSARRDSPTGRQAMIVTIQ